MKHLGSLASWEQLNALNDKLKDYERLQKENDKLRAQLLQAPDAKMVAFMAAFGLWLERERNFEKDAYEKTGHVVRLERYERTQTILNWYTKLKAQHLGDSEGE